MDYFYELYDTGRIYTFWPGGLAPAGCEAVSRRSRFERDGLGWLPLPLHPVILCLLKVNRCLQEMNTPAPLKLKIEVPQDKVADFCRRWKISEFALFGSVLRDDFRPDSDIDVLVTFASDARWGLFALYEMEQELKKIFGREVDLVSRRGIEASRNYIRRKAILRSAEVVYATG